MSHAETAGRPAPPGLLQSLIQASPELVISEPLFHPATVNGAVWSPDGKYIASACADGAAYIWDFESKKQVQRIYVNRSPVQVIAYRPMDRKSDDKRYYIATGSNDGSVAFIDISTGKIAWRFTEHVGSIESLLFSPDGKYLVSTGIDKRAVAYNLISGQLTRIIGPMQHGPIFSLMTAQNELVVFDANNKTEAWSLDHNYSMHADQRKVTDSFAMQSARKNEKSLQEQKIIKILRTGNGTTFLNEIGSVARRTIDTELRHSNELRYTDSIISDFVLQSNLITSFHGTDPCIIGYENGSISIADIASLRDDVSKARLRRTANPMITLEGHTGAVRTIEVLRHRGKHIIATAGNDHSVRIWDLWRGRGTFLVSRFSYAFDNLNPKTEGWFSPGIFSFTDETLYSLSLIRRPWYKIGTYDIEKREYDIQNRNSYMQVRTTIEAATNRNRLFLSIDGRLLGICGAFAQSGCEIWTLLKSAKIPAHKVRTVEFAQSVEFSDDGRLAAFLMSSKKEGAYTEIQDTLSGKVYLRVPGDSFYGRFSADARAFATVSIAEIAVWNLNQGTKVVMQTGGSSARTLQLRFSPSGDRIALANQEHKIHIFDTRTGQFIQTLRGHKETIRDVRFLPSGLELASVDEGGRILNWHLGNEYPVIDFAPGSTNSGKSMLSVSGERVALVGGDFSTPEPMIYPAQPRKFFEFACKLLKNIPERYREIAKFCDSYHF